MIEVLPVAELIDRLNLIICPVIGGSGFRLLDEGLPPSEWTLVHRGTSEPGVLVPTYDRVR